MWNTRLLASPTRSANPKSHAICATALLCGDNIEREADPAGLRLQRPRVMPVERRKRHEKASLGTDLMMWHHIRPMPPLFALAEFQPAVTLGIIITNILGYLDVVHAAEPAFRVNMRRLMTLFVHDHRPRIKPV